MNEAFELWRRGAARVADIIGIVLLGALGWQVMFAYGDSFETSSLWVGVIGVAACWLTPHSIRNLPWAATGWAAIALVSSAAHRWSTAPHPPNAGWTELFTPAFHLVVMVTFVYGTAHLLRTRERLSWFTVALAGSICVLAIQLLFDRTRTNFIYNRAGSTDLPSIAQWAGMHQAGLVLTVGLPMVLAISQVERSIWRVLSGLLLGGGLGLAAFLDGSRSALVTMAVTAVAMVLAPMFAGRASGRLQRIVSVCLMAMAVLLVAVIFIRTATSMVTVTASNSGRTQIWTAAGWMFLEHPWLGVGPGNYTAMMLDGGYAQRFLPWFPQSGGGVEQAHNLPLQVAAETGVIGLACVLAFFGWMLRACWRVWRQAVVPIVACALLFAIAAFFIRNLTDNFLDLGITSDRMRVFAWLLFAAALALERLPRAMSKAPA